MVFKSIIGATCTCLAAVSFNATAMPIESDWITAGDGLITYDANSNLEWLDLTLTFGRTYDEVSSLFGVGQEFFGWRYATKGELSDLWTSFGVYVSDNAWNPVNNGLYDPIAQLMGEPCPVICEGQTGRFTNWLTAASLYATTGTSDGEDYFRLWNGPYPNDLSSAGTGSALVRISSVPVPATVWLFGSGLIGLIGVARRKKSLRV